MPLPGADPGAERRKQDGLLRGMRRNLKPVPAGIHEALGAVVFACGVRDTTVQAKRNRSIATKALPYRRAWSWVVGRPKPQLTLLAGHRHVTYATGDDDHGRDSLAVDVPALVEGASAGRRIGPGGQSEGEGAIGCRSRGKRRFRGTLEGDGPSERTRSSRWWSAHGLKSACHRSRRGLGTGGAAGDEQASSDDGHGGAAGAPHIQPNALGPCWFPEVRN